MAIYEGNMHFYWLATNPADTAAPTTTEIEAGDEVTIYVTKDGWNPGVTNNRVSQASIAETFDAESQGSWGSQVSLTMFIERNGTTVGWDTLGTRGVTGCLVVTPDGPATATERAYVYPDAETGTPVLPASAANEEQKFTVDLAVGSSPDLDAIVAA